MKRPFFPIRAHIALRHVDAAFAAGSLDQVSMICQHYLVARLPKATLPLQGADAHVALWAAFAAMYFDDAPEVNAALEMVHPRWTGTREQRVWTTVSLFSAALQGNLDPFSAPPPNNEEPWAAFARVVAIEHAYDKLTPELVTQFRASIKPAEFACAALRSRAFVVSAILALCDGEPDEAIQIFAKLRDATAPMIVALSAMARGEFQAVRAEWPDLSPDERTTVLHYGVFLLGSADSNTLRQALDILEGIAKGAPREALVALRVIKLAREGNNKVALEVGSEELQKATGESPILACATASAALMDGNASAAMIALRKAPSNESMALALHWMALAVTGNDAQLSREIVRDALSLSADYSAPLSTVVLAALARSGTTFDGQMPPWLKPNDNDANGHYAQGLVFLHRRAAEDAMTSFERALKIDSKLQALGDAPDVARLFVAIKHFGIGDSKAAKRMLATMKSPHLQPLAERLELLVVLRELAKDKKLPLDEQGLATLVDKLASSGAHSKSVAALQAELVCRRVRKLLRDGNVVEARSVRKELLAIDSPDATYLLAVVDACDDHVPLEETAKKLDIARNKTPTHAGLAVLSGEVAATLQGNEAGIAVLEASVANTSGRLVGHALTDAYRRAHRGLDAKRAWFVGMKGAENEASREYAKEMREILEFESPPFSTHGQKVTHKAREAFLSFDGLFDRVPMLLIRTKAAMTRDPNLREPLEMELEKLKAGMKTKDVANALKAELEIVKIASATWA